MFSQILECSHSHTSYCGWISSKVVVYSKITDRNRALHNRALESIYVINLGLNHTQSNQQKGIADIQNICLSVKPCPQHPNARHALNWWYTWGQIKSSWYKLRIRQKIETWISIKTKTLLYTKETKYMYVKSCTWIPKTWMKRESTRQRCAHMGFEPCIHRGPAAENLTVEFSRIGFLLLKRVSVQILEK